MREATSEERGAVLMLGAVALTALMVVAALVVDIGLVRVDRNRNRAYADSISTAGVIGLRNGGGIDGCEAAAGYVEVTFGPHSLACDGFPAICTEGVTTTATTQATIDENTVTLTYPVLDSSPLMAPTSGGDQSLSDRDGESCGRFGVTIGLQRAALFARFAGQETVGTQVHSVALVGDPIGPPSIASLLLTEPSNCPVLISNGGGTNGGILIDSVVDPATGEVHPGRIAIDTDGSGVCDAALLTSGGHANVHARGEPGCATEVAPGDGWGCGEIEIVAPGAPGCNPPACMGEPGTVMPPPEPAQRPRTRAPFDWRFNCKPVYPESYGIPGCPDSDSKSSYIDDLILGTSFGGSFSYYPGGVADGSCRISPSESVVVPEGNWIIDCPAGLRVQGSLEFEGGNLIVDGDIDLGAGASLRINTNSADSTYSWVEGSMVDADEYSAEAIYIFFRDGELMRNGSADLEMHHAFVYLSPTSTLTMAGGDGVLTWTSPTEGPFTGLALWSDSSLDIDLAGNAAITLEGILFAPTSPVTFSGNGGVYSINSQLVAQSLTTNGNGTLRLSPTLTNSVTHLAVNDSELIR